MNISKEDNANEKLKIENLIAENNKLRRELWLLQSRGAFPISIFLLISGAISLILAYIYSNTLLLLIGLGVIYIGAVIFYITPSRYISYSLLYELSLSINRLLNSIVLNTSNKRAVILHTNDINGLIYGHLFITDDINTKLPIDISSNNTNMVDNTKGMLLPSPLYGIVTLIEKNLNVNFAYIPLESIILTLSDTFKHLKLVDDISIEVINKSVKIVFKGEDAIKLCKASSRSIPINGHPSCPICTSIAFIVSKSMNKPVYISENIIENESVSTLMEVLD